MYSKADSLDIEHEIIRLETLLPPSNIRVMVRNNVNEIKFFWSFFFISYWLVNNRNNEIPWEIQKQKKSFSVISVSLAVTELQKGLNLIFSYFMDICTCVSLFSKELTMPVHNGSDNETNFSHKLNVGTKATAREKLLNLKQNNVGTNELVGARIGYSSLQCAADLMKLPPTPKTIKRDEYRFNKISKLNLTDLYTI
jgi:hypothetical protein